MTPAEALYADLRSRGIDLETDGERVRWRPASMVSPRDERRIADVRPDLIRLLRSGLASASCPRCSWPLDAADRCPKCFDRVCERCTRMTGSYFIRLCTPCGHNDGLDDS